MVMVLGGKLIVCLLLVVLVWDLVFVVVVDLFGWVVCGVYVDVLV